MPAKSVAQQRFMGMVHALQKGDIKPSKVSGKVKDVAKSMKKKDAEDFASTKHKNKPYKVKKEVVKKLREIIRQEVESCGYTMSAENPKRKLKSPGGTGPEDRDLKEGKRALKAYNNIHKARNEFIERYSKLRKQLNTLKTESPNNEILRLEKQLYKFEMAFIEQSSKLLGSVSKIAKSNLTEEFNYKRNTPRSLKKSRFKQLDVLVPRGRVNWVIKALKKEIRGIKISHEEVDSYTKDGLILSKFKKDDINKIMKIVDHAGGLFENKMYKKGDVVKLLSFNRREKGKARVKGVTKARPNKFGIKNHYITNKGTFSDMEVEGTKAFKLRFKGNTEKKVMKAMGLESVNEKVIVTTKKDDIKGNPMKMKGEEKIKKLAWSGSVGMKKPGSYEIKGNKLNVNNIRPRDKGFFVRHFTMGTGFRKANLYYDGIHWQGKKKF